jgi:hypothetical protein
MISAKVSGYTVDMTDIIDKANEQTILRGCINLCNQMKSLAPLDHGRLRNSIQWKTTLGEGGINDHGGEQESERIDETPSSVAGFAGATAYYAIYVEKGFLRRNGKHQPAQPFAEPSVQLVFNGMSIVDLANTFGSNLQEMSSRGKRTSF